MGSVGGMARTEELSPFALEDVHHTSIEGGSITRTKWHYTETILLVIGSEERQLLLITEADSDLVVSSFVVKGDEVQTTVGVAEVVDGVVATRNRVLEG
jgi:hypothetical protein